MWGKELLPIADDYHPAQFDHDGRLMLMQTPIINLVCFGFAASRIARPARRQSEPVV